MIKVLALFDDSHSSVRKSWSDDFVLSVGLNPCDDDVLVMDLSVIENLQEIVKLHKVHNFDLIFANPPCESWSRATNCKNGTVYRNLPELNLRTFNEWLDCGYNNVNKIILGGKYDLKKKYLEYFERGLNGNKTADFTLSVIETLKLPFIIENPTQSLLFRYIKDKIDFVENRTFYSAYNESFSLKPTTFASNFKLNLKEERILTGNMRSKKGRNDKSVRSLIPENLLLDIRNQLDGLI